MDIKSSDGSRISQTISANPNGATYYLAKFGRKLLENEEKLDGEEISRPKLYYVDPSLKSGLPRKCFILLGVDVQLTVHPPDTVPATTESAARIPEMKRHMSSSEGYDTMTDATSEAMSEVTSDTSDSLIKAIFISCAINWKII